MIYSFALCFLITLTDVTIVILNANSQAANAVLPLGLPPLPVPKDNPLSPEKIELGKMLFFDARMSDDNTISCASCHDPTHGYAEPRKVPTGVNNQKGTRNTPTILNAAYLNVLFWDGRARDLETQAEVHLNDSAIMGESIESMALRLNDIPEYRQQFLEVFGKEAGSETIVRAIAAFERTILSGNSPYDRYLEGDETALTSKARAGMKLFQDKANCATCHPLPLLTNQDYVSAGVGLNEPSPDLGRGALTNIALEKGAFRVPSLRDVERTAPYMHDGSVETLEDAVRFMVNGGIPNPNLPIQFRIIPKLTDEEIDRLVEFMKSLTGAAS